MRFKVAVVPVKVTEVREPPQAHIAREDRPCDDAPPWRAIRNATCKTIIQGLAGVAFLTGPLNARSPASIGTRQRGRSEHFGNSLGQTTNWRNRLASAATDLFLRVQVTCVK